MTIETSAPATTSAPAVAAPAVTSPAPAPASAPAATPSSSEMTAEEVLRFDPFGSNEGTSGSSASNAGGDGSQEEPAPTPPTPPAQPPATTPTTPAAENPEMALMRKQLEDARALLQTGQPTEAQPAPANSPYEAVPAYDFNINDELIGALNSGDPQAMKIGLAAVSQGVAQAVHKTILAQIKTAIGPHLMQQMVQGMQAQQQQEQVAKDFYGTYPELNTPALRSVVLSTAQQLAAETGASEYSPQFRDAVAARVRSVLGMQVPQAQPTPLPQPPVMLGGGNSRPGGLSAEEANIKAIKELFS